MQKLSDRYPNERDKRIFLDEKTHSYTVDGVSNYISVTSFKENWFKIPFDAKKIADRMARRPEFDLDSDELQQRWKAKNSLKRKMGIDLHSWIDDFFNEAITTVTTNGDYLRDYLERIGCEGITISDLKEANRAWYNFIKFVKANNTWIPFRTEWRIFHERYKLAGTIDAIFKIPLKDDGFKYVLCDWKRVRHLRFESKTKLGDAKKFKGLGEKPATNYWEYSIQLNLYRIILEDCYNIKIEEMIIVRLSEVGKNFELHLVQREDEPCRAILESRAIHL